MTPTGHPRTGGRRAGPAVAVVLLLILAASLLVSAGSPHHQAAAASGAGTAPVADHAEQPADGLAELTAADHEHHHGNDWTPTPSRQLRPAADAGNTATVAACAPGSPAGTEPIPASAPAPGEDLLLLGVLRI